MTNISKKKILTQIDQLKVEIESTSIQIDLERKDSSEDETAVQIELSNKRDMLVNKLDELENSLVFENDNDPNIGKIFTIVMNGSSRELTVTHSFDANPRKGLISIDSPLAKNLIGKNAGDEVHVETPAGNQTYKITKIS